MELRQEIRHLRDVKWNNEREIYRLTNKLREAEHLLEKERRAHMNIGAAIKSLEEAHKIQECSLKGGYDDYNQGHIMVWSWHCQSCVIKSLYMHSHVA